LGIALLSHLADELGDVYIKGLAAPAGAHFRLEAICSLKHLCSPPPDHRRVFFAGLHAAPQELAGNVRDAAALLTRDPGERFALGLFNEKLSAMQSLAHGSPPGNYTP
jgi:hypothetical protein